jgi:hypothetical protein
MSTILTEGDVDRGNPPDLARLHALAVLAQHLPPTHPMFGNVLDWCVRYGAVEVFVRRLAEARRMRDAGPLTDGELMASWALQQPRREVRR